MNQSVKWWAFGLTISLAMWWFGFAYIFIRVGEYEKAFWLTIGPPMLGVVFGIIWVSVIMHEHMEDW